MRIECEARSHAIINDHATESAAVHGAGAGARVSRNSGGSGPLRVARYALTPFT